MQGVARKLAVLVAGAGLVLGLRLAAFGAPQGMLVIAHRGAALEAPQNTLASLRRAIELGCDYAELDLRTTADGKIIDMHNDTVDGTTNGVGKVRDLKLADIRKLDAGSWFGVAFRTEKVPLFAEELAVAKGRIKLYLDMKNADPAQVVRLVEQFDMVDDVVIYGGARLLKAVLAANPGIAVMPHLDKPEDMPALAETLHPRVVENSGGRFNPAVVQAAHAHGAKVFLDVQDVSEEKDYILECLNAGVDAIQVNEPRAALEVLRCAGVAHRRAGPAPEPPPVRGERRDNGRVKLIAHRGAGNLAPMNTLPAAAEAIRRGIDYIETDVRASKDGLLVNWHNDEVDRVTNGKGLVSDLSYREIRALDAGAWFSPRFAGAYIPLLAEVMAMAKDRAGLYLDWKNGDPQAVVFLLQNFDMTRDVLVHARPDVCLQIRALDPTIVLMPGADGVKGVREVAAAVHPQAVEIRWMTFEADSVRVCHELGMMAMTSHANSRGDTPEGMRRSVLAGFDGFETDHLDLALEILRVMDPAPRRSPYHFWD